MPLAIITSDAQSRHSILLVLNITGVIACIFTIILLVLTALNVIFKEPDITPVMQDHVTNFTQLSYLLGRRAYNPFLPIEDTFLYYLDMLTEIN